MISNLFASVVFFIGGYIFVYKGNAVLDFEEYIQTEFFKRELSKKSDRNQQLRLMRTVGRVVIGSGIFTLILAILQYLTIP